MDQETKDKRARHAIESTLLYILPSQGEGLDLRVRREVKQAVNNLSRRLIHNEDGLHSALTSLQSVGIGRPDFRKKVINDASWESPRVQQIIRRTLYLGLPKDPDGD